MENRRKVSLPQGCGRCMYFKFSYEEGDQKPGYPDEHEPGLCRRNPDLLDRSSEDWCGEYKKFDKSAHRGVVPLRRPLRSEPKVDPLVVAAVKDTDNQMAKIPVAMKDALMDREGPQEETVPGKDAPAQTEQKTAQVPGPYSDKSGNSTTRIE